MSLSAADAAAAVSTDAVAVANPVVVKRGRGRPKGSKDKVKRKKGSGRPKGAKDKKKRKIAKKATSTATGIAVGKAVSPKKGPKKQMVSAPGSTQV